MEKIKRISVKRNRWYNKELQNQHKKHNTLFSIGVYIEAWKLPYEEGLRGLYNESGLKVMFYNDEG